MNIAMWAIAKAMTAWLGSKNCQKMVEDLGDNIDKAIDEKAGKQSENLQEAFVRNITMPLQARLMRENPSRLNTIYEAEQHRLMGGIVYEDPKPADKKAGQNFGPKK